MIYTINTYADIEFTAFIAKDYEQHNFKNFLITILNDIELYSITFKKIVSLNDIIMYFLIKAYKKQFNYVVYNEKGSNGEYELRFYDGYEFCCRLNIQH